MQDMLLEKAEELERRSIFLGGPKARFVTAGRGQLEILLSHGLTPDDSVLDVGCGALRGGWWLINFLRPERYFGIEPNREMLEAGIDVMLGPSLLGEKRPAFSTTADFDFSVFGRTFDFGLARSVWTHASRHQLRTMLRSFRQCSHEKSLFLASIVEPEDGAAESAAMEWVGRSHMSAVPGIARYRFTTIAALCSEEGFAAERLAVSDGQLWVKIARQS